MERLVGIPDPIATLAEEKTTADRLIQPWQKELKAGDCFYFFSLLHGLVAWGEVLENQTDPALEGYRYCRCYLQTVPEGMDGYVHVSVLHKKISRSILEKARKANWPHDEIHFIKFASQITAEKTMS